MSPTAAHKKIEKPGTKPPNASANAGVSVLGEMEYD
jgi:hypothetical protein